MAEGKFAGSVSQKNVDLPALRRRMVGGRMMSRTSLSFSLFLCELL